MGDAQEGFSVLGWGTPCGCDGWAATGLSSSASRTANRIRIGTLPFQVSLAARGGKRKGAEPMGPAPSAQKGNWALVSVAQAQEVIGAGIVVVIEALAHRV